MDLLFSAWRFFDLGDGTVRDNVSRLIWLKDANYARTEGYDSDGLMTWYDAMDWVDYVNGMEEGNGYAGHNDWRLPTKEEWVAFMSTVYLGPALVTSFPHNRIIQEVICCDVSFLGTQA